MKMNNNFNRILFWLLVCSAVTMQSCRTISQGTFTYNADEQKRTINFGTENLLWDTGSDISLFFSPPYARKIRMGRVVTYDGARMRHIFPVWFSHRISVDSITIKNMLYVLPPQRKVPDAVMSTNEGKRSGIIGMNVINRANWLVDFVDKTIHIIPHNGSTIEELPVLRLSYRRSKYPRVTLIVQGIEIENVLLDTGASGDLYLPKTVLERLHRNIHPIDSGYVLSTGLYTDDIRRRIYRYTDITVSGILLDTFTIRQAGSAYIGMGFFERFNQLYLDTKNQEMLLYK